MSENKNEFETIDFSVADNEVKNTSNKPDNKNIFSEFNTDSSLQTEIKKIEEKNKIYYLSISLKILQWIFLILVIVVWILLSYIFIQKSESFVDNISLNPICYIFNWDIWIIWSWCSSVTVNNSSINTELNELYNSQTTSILSILPTIYETESFLNAKEVSFLVDKTENKLKVLDIIEKFDYFKNQFTWIEKKKLQCFDLEINQLNKILSMKCEAYSSWYSSEIIWFSWDKSAIWDFLNWTSISIANSFINFLNKNAWKYFLVIDRNKKFKSENVDWKDWYTNKTNFELKLKINF